MILLLGLVTSPWRIFNLDLHKLKVITKVDFYKIRMNIIFNFFRGLIDLLSFTLILLSLIAFWRWKFIFYALNQIIKNEKILINGKFIYDKQKINGWDKL